MKQMTFSLINLGCKVNKVEADSIGAALLAVGWQAVNSGADVAIVNTCTVTAEADRKTRKEVNRAVTHNFGAPVLVTGCAAAIDPAAYEALSEAVRVIEKGSVVDECLAIAREQGKSVEQGSGSCCELEQGSGPCSILEADGTSVVQGQALEHAPILLRVGEEFPTRVGVKVQDGCDNACTFCIVHVARGRAWSVPVQQIVDEVAQYAKVGVREIVLTGIDLGAYHFENVGLAALVMQLRAVAPETRLRISSIEPHTLDDALIEVLATQDGMVCRHLHVPLQSGSSRVLRDMARHYSAEEYLATIEKLRAAVPELSLSTDAIVGFPGETEEDFAATLDVASKCGFSRMHFFRYSKREGTPAAARPDQLAPELKANRLKRLELLAAELRLADAQTRVGTRERVLVEAKGKAMSESYFEVRVPESYQRGSLIEATLQTYNEKDGTFSL